MKYLVFFSILFFYATANAQNAAIAKGNDYYKEGRYELAESQYRKSGEDPVAQFNLANALIRQKKTRDALTILNGLGKTKDVQLRASSYFNAGVIYTREKDLEAAIEAYKSCLRIRPDDKEARENLQKALLELKRTQNKKPENTQSRISNSQADQKLQELQEKERKLQKKLDAQKKGQSMENDW